MSTKVKLISFVLSCCLVFIIFYVIIVLNSKNKDPAISNVKVLADTTRNFIEVTFDLYDAEEDKSEIVLEVFNRRKGTIAMGVVTGDSGTDILPGKGKKIKWYYNKISPISDYNIKIKLNTLNNLEASTLVNQVDTLRLRKTLLSIYGNRSYKNFLGKIRLQRVKKLIDDSFSENGLQVQRQSVMYKRYIGHNIIGKLQGQENSKKAYVVCAHFDTADESPGADDNGSGVAGMLEVMKILSKYNFKHSIIFVALDLEEEGSLGSQRYASEIKAKRIENIEGVINFDMIGTCSYNPDTQDVPPDFNLQFPEIYQKIVDNKFKADFVLNVSNKGSETFGNIFNKCAAQHVPALKVIPIVVNGNGEDHPEFASSDHIKFWLNGYKAIHIGEGGSFRNEWMDTELDRIEQLNYSFMGNIVQATVATLVELAELQKTAVYIYQIKIAPN